MYLYCVYLYIYVYVTKNIYIYVVYIYIYHLWNVESASRREKIVNSHIYIFIGEELISTSPEVIRWNLNVIVTSQICILIRP